MDYQNLNTLISSRDFAQPWAFPPPPKEPAQSAPKESWEKYWKAMDAYYERYGQSINPQKKKSILGSVKDAASKVYTGVGKQFTDPKSALQRTAARGYGDDAEAKGALRKAQKSGDPLTRVLRTSTGVVKAGEDSLEYLRTQLGGGPVGRNYQKTVDQLAKKGISVGKDDFKDIVAGKSSLRIKSPTVQNQAISAAKDSINQLSIDRDLQRTKVKMLQNSGSPEVYGETYNLLKSEAKVDKAEKALGKLKKERENYLNKAEAAKSSARADLAKAAQKDKEKRDERAFQKGAKVVSTTKDVADSALSMVSKTHAAKEARRIGAGGVQARNARVAYLLGDRSKATRLMSGHYFEGNNAVSRYLNKKLTKSAIKKVNERGFSDDLDLLKLREAEAISYMLSKDYTQFEDFSEIARPTVVKTSKIGKEELENGKVLSDEVEIPYVREQSMLKDPVDLLEKNYYQASPEEKKFQESLFVGFSEESDGGNYEKTLESLSKIVNPYE